MQITNMKIIKQQQVSTNYNGSYLSHAARHPTGLLHGLTDYTISMQQRMQWNPKVRQRVKKSPERQPDMGQTKWTRWKHETCNRISSLGCVHTTEAPEKHIVTSPYILAGRLVVLRWC